MRRVSLEYGHFNEALWGDFWRWENFSPSEMACRATGRLKVGRAFMDKLQKIRKKYGRPIQVISGYRTPEHNLAVTGNRSMSGAHTFGRAVDINLAGGPADVPVILGLAWECGMTRCGLQVSSKRFKFHLDDMTAGEGFAVRTDGRGLLCWTY